MNIVHSKFFVTVYVIIRQGNDVLLLLRENTGFEDGNYCLVSGFLEKEETVTEAAVREAREEVGIDIHPNNLAIKAILHRNSNGGHIDFIFECENWIGDPINNEPGKCSEVNWFCLDKLPANLIPFVRYILMSRENMWFEEYGWI